ncbi:MAG: tRNA A-37 threonylcarbamoyl transferase component Bud32 [Pseudohongiellaceae bacterium]|jgi:tRNA A-37 threonylcarbamoyl transferase component Bud32
MTDERYARIKELFHSARQLKGSAREKLLAEACGDDAALLEEVTSLLEHDRADTLIADSTAATVAVDQSGADGIPEALARATQSGLSRTQRLVFVGRVMGAHRRRVVFGVALIVCLVSFGLWTFDQVEVSLDKLLTDQLQTVLNAEETALRQWLAAVETDAQLWAAHPDVRREVLALVELGDSSASPAKDLQDSPHLPRLIGILAGSLRRPEEVFARGEAGGREVQGVLLTHRRFDGFAVSSASGLILGGHAPGGMKPEGIGESMSDRSLAAMEEVIEGKTVVVPPADLEGNRFVPHIDEPLMLVLTPVYGESAQPRAMLAFFVEPSEEYAAVLAAGRIGETGQTYTFDERGLMLSESACLDQLVELGVLASESATAVLQIQLRDPGGDLTEGYVPALAMADRPRTRLAATAIDGRSSGINIEGYRDYRGVEVVGAWAWLDEYHFGIATEVNRAEGYQAMAALIRSFRILFWGAVLLSVGVLSVAMHNVSLKAAVDRARQYGDYRVVRVLGEGGLGTVFLAEHKLLVRPAAVKVLRKDRITPESEQRFQQEVQLTSQLTNPHTVELYDFGRTTSGEFYYAMEYLPGLTLHELIERYGAQRQERVVHILWQICESLAEAHDLDIIHRDIKPMNILICERGGRFDVVKVLDFGLVKDLEAPEELALTRAAEVSGSPLYMAPERFSAPLTVDARSDIWAVGCVAYTLLTGNEPFQGRSVREIFKKVTSSQPPSLDHGALAPVHPALKALVMSCLEKDRNDRPASVHEISAALETMDVGMWSWDDARQWWEEHVSELPHPPKIVRGAVT